MAQPRVAARIVGWPSSVKPVVVMTVRWRVFGLAAACFGHPAFFRPPPGVADLPPFRRVFTSENPHGSDSRESSWGSSFATVRSGRAGCSRAAAGSLIGVVIIGWASCSQSPPASVHRLANLTRKFLFRAAARPRSAPRVIRDNACFNGRLAPSRRVPTAWLSPDPADLYAP